MTDKKEKVCAYCTSESKQEVYITRGSYIKLCDMHYYFYKLGWEASENYHGNTVKKV